MNQIFRLIRIYIIIMKNSLDKDLFNFKYLWLLKILRIFFPNLWFRKFNPSRGERLKKTFEELGPIFVKLGQTISTRKDLLPPDIANELVKLQDKVTPFSGEIAKQEVEKALEDKVENIFEEFDINPLASASVAQVHAATLNQNKVIVKVLRPGISKLIKKDISLMYFIANTIDRIWDESKRLKPKEIVSEYEKVIFGELDLIKEASNANLLKKNFKDSSYLYVPNIYWDYTRENVLVMERIFGIQISDTEELNKNNINIKRLAEKGVEIFFTQVFQHNFFHADMHPGNIFVSYDNPDDPKYCAVDFGIMGSLSDSDQKYLALNFQAFFRRDYKKVAELHVDSGWVGENTRIDEFENSIRSVCEPIFEKPLKDISFGNLLLRLFSVARQYDMNVQPQLVLLQKTLLNIEGLGRDLYPDLDLWVTAKPFFEKWAKENMSISSVINKMSKNSARFIDEITDFPETMSLIKKKLKDNKVENEIKELKTNLKNSQLKNAILFLILIFMIVFEIIK
ncbi:MAG: ubiquinone biosynthesis regulatory protein kinase UbiB [Gammaproteobacteria bacterium]|jgi:ubiquinone biosynthesis protein